MSEREVADRGSKAGRGRRAKAADPAGQWRADRLPGPIRDRMRGIVPAGEEN